MAVTKLRQKRVTSTVRTTIFIYLFLNISNFLTLKSEILSYIPNFAHFLSDFLDVSSIKNDLQRTFTKHNCFLT